MFLFTILQEAVTITVFVLVMMIVIEYITIQYKRKSKSNLPSNPFIQILFAAFMGLIPGCLGSYAVVSLYVHGSLSLAALTAAFVATSGDEAFIMISMIPETALKLMGIILIAALIVGIITHYLSKGKMYGGKSAKHQFIHTDEPKCRCHNLKLLPKQLINMIWQRAVILLFGIGFLILLIFFGDTHENGFHIIEQAGNHAEHSGSDWERIIFFIVTIIGLFIALTVTDHFLKKHLWAHVIKKHFLRLLLWTFATFFVLHFLNEYVDVKELIKGNVYIVLFIAALIGMIPESGPHIIFISMFATGLIPFPVLLTNSIVQDGHGSIPLIAESGKSFIVVKLINFAAGLLFGYLLLFIS